LFVSPVSFTVSNNFSKLFDGRQYYTVFRTVKYADDLSLLTKLETAPQGVTE